MLLAGFGLAAGHDRAQVGTGIEDVNVEIRLDIKGDAPDGDLKPRILSGSLALVSSSTRKADPADPVVLPVERAGVQSIRLPAETIWRVSASIDGYWSAGSVWTLPEAGASITKAVELWPTGKVSGRAKFATQEESLPQRIAMKFQSPRHFGFQTPQGPVDAELVPESTVECPIDGTGAWSCDVPATTLDLALRVKKHISHYLWDVDVRRGETAALGTFSFRRGASLVGRVEADDGVVVAGKCTARLLPRIATGGGDPVLSTQIRSMEITGAVGRNGFFQLDGTPAGTYVLEVEQAGFAPARVFPVEIWPDSETTLRDPVVLRRPLTLEISVDPPLDAFGKRWQVLVFRASESSAGYDTAPIYDDRADLDGGVKLPGQSPGNFAVNVADSRGDQVYSDYQIAVEAPDDARIGIHVDLISVRGKLSLGDEPLAGTLWFGGRHGAVSFEMQADAEGEFEGVLVRRDTWWVDVDADQPRVETQTRVEVHPDDEGEAWVSISLPDTEVFGLVVDPTGRGLEGASVYGTAAGEYSMTTISGAGGEFRFRGFEHGAMSLGARSDTADGVWRSDVTLVSVEGSQPVGPIELRLESTREIWGTVSSPRGPVVGALVVVRTWRPVEAYFSDTGRTDLTGIFTARVAEGAKILQAIVSPTGNALSSFLFTADEDPQFEVWAEGGELEISLAEPRMPILFQGNLLIDHQILWQWAQGHGVRYFTEESLTVRIPSLAPGAYRACLPDRRKMAEAALTVGDWRTALDESQCLSGFLSTGSTLKLDFTSIP